MKTIWKFAIPVVNPAMIRMPKGAEILTVQRQGDQACLWAIVEPEAEKEQRYFIIEGTGNPIHEEDGVTRKYIGTFQAPQFVWHVFERMEQQ
jgi:hypothetical protein